MEIPFEINRKILRYEPIECEGLTFYPIRVSEYSEYSIARSAIEFIQRRLPVSYWSMPILSAFFKIDYEAIERDGQPAINMFANALLFLCLSLRLGEGMSPEMRLRLLTPIVNRDDPYKLIALEFTDSLGQKKRITPVQFARLRPILAAQNGLKLVSDNANPDLVDAENDVAAANGPKLDVTVDNLIAAVAAITNIGESDIDEWPILKLLKRQETYRRMLNFVICGIGETQGTKWKGGNPYPDPFFSRISEDSSAAIPIETYAGGEGLRAIQNAGIPVNNDIKER